MKKEIVWGIIAGIGLLTFYFLIMIVATRNWSSTFSQFRSLWYWVILLSLGFGIQVGLYVRVRKLIHSQAASSVAAATAGTSSFSMVACCVHHLSDAVPILGLSGASIFLTRYQIPIILFGVIMNGLGIAYMIETIKKLHKKA